MKVTYLFGAGASANTLPPNKGFRDELKKLAAEISIHPFNEKNLDESKKGFAAEVEWLVAETWGITIDDLAKRFIDNIAEPMAKANLLRLKLILALCLSYWQRTRPPDPRYLGFYPKLFANGVMEIPPETTILSWNYDSQFELSYGAYILKPQPFKWYWQSKEKLKALCKHYTIGTDYSSHRLIQLNGNAAELKGGKCLFSEEIDIKDYIGLLRAWEYHRETAEPSISFACEPHEGGISIVEYAKQSVKGTDVLVVIGYAFAETNHRIDREILLQLSGVEKIVIQDLEPQRVEDNIKEIFGDNYAANQIEYEHRVVGRDGIDPFPWIRS